MMSREVLTERLLEAEIALHKLLTGRSTVSLSQAIQREITGAINTHRRVLNSSERTLSS